MSIASIRPDWRVASRVQAAMSLRHGGVSAAPYDSLNVGAHVGDAAADVARNRALLGAALSLPAEPLWLQQVHGTAVLEAGAPRAVPPVADAAFTRAADVVLAIMVADCLPVLLADRRGEVIAAAHAGWRGLAAGVLPATLAAMGAPAGDLSAWLGPAIRQAHFEVGEEVRQAFVDADADSAADFRRNERGRWQCDLPGLARRQLRALGVRAVSDCGLCTYERAQQCFSFRRDGRTGRMAALLWLRA